DHGDPVLHALGRQPPVSQLRPVLHVHRIAFLRRARDRGPAAALLAQVGDHAVDVFLGALGGVAHHLQLLDLDLAELRDQLEIRAVGDLAALLAAFDRLDPGVAGDLELVLADHGVEALAQQAVEHLGADLRAEALPDDAGRELAGAEALDAGRARDPAHRAADRH